MNKNFSKAEKSLIESDPKLGKVIENNGHLQFSIKKIDPFNELVNIVISQFISCLLYTSPSPRDRQKSRMPSSA